MVALVTGALGYSLAAVGLGPGLVIGDLGVFVLSWSDPLVIGWPFRRQRREAKRQEAEEAQAARERWRPAGYGQQPELIWNARSSEANNVLATIAADGRYDLVSINSLTTGDPGWAANKRTILHLRMKR
jgi:hypothetical protein